MKELVALLIVFIGLFILGVPFLKILEITFWSGIGSCITIIILELSGLLISFVFPNSGGTEA